ncbi:MAG: Y-family DNA polymerase [Flavisolibacter sp.]
MIALIDCNNFYCSCETVFDPSLQKKPVIVLSNNDGCAIARSKEAKLLGIKMAQPAFMAKDLIDKYGIKVFSSNYTLYGDMSQRVINVIKEFIPRTEVYSIDELFADLSDLKYQDHYILATEIKEAVNRCTGIPVTIGIGQTKTIAKLANRHAKREELKEGVFCAETNEARIRLLKKSNVGDIWGIGRQLADLLNQNGIYTGWDLLNTPEEWVRKNLSVKGQRLLHELKGVPCIEWEEADVKRKNICTSRSFGKLITTKKEMKQAVATFTFSCAEKLRKEGSCAKKITVFIQTNPHRPLDKQFFQTITLQLAVATNLSAELIKSSMKGLDMIFQAGYYYQKAGVVVQELVPEEQIQLGLFDSMDRAKNRQLMISLDEVNHSFGKGTVRYGVQDYETRWKLKQEKLSHAFTTKTSELPKAKAN